MSRLIALLAAILVLETALIAQQSATPAQNPPAGRGDAAAPPIGQGGQHRPGHTVSIAAREECPPGKTLVRVGTCQSPEFPPPSIVDYRPKSSLIVEEHPVPRAK